VTSVKFPDFFINIIENIINNKQPHKPKKFPTIYNLMVRLTTAFDHNQDASVSNVSSQFKETGTLLKTIITLVLTFITILILIFIGLLIMDLLNQIYGFLYSIYTELVFRF